MMLRNAFKGVAAGAIGTVALNISTYTDMVIRARAASQVPGKIAATMTEKAGISLEGTGTEQEAQNAAQHRHTGLGALFGYITGLGVGMLYGLVRPYLRRVPIPLLGVGVGVAAMAGSDIPATLSGVTDPRKWSGSTWFMDFGFHLVYGLATAVAYDVLELD